MRARYTVLFVSAELVHIEDIGHTHTASVTNDAEAVVRDLYERYGDRRFIYNDSDGRTDELMHSNGVFHGFAPYRPYREK